MFMQVLYYVKAMYVYVYNIYGTYVLPAVLLIAGKAPRYLYFVLVCILWVQLFKFIWYLHANMCKYVYICAYVGQNAFNCIIMHVWYYKCINMYIIRVYT